MINTTRILYVSLVALTLFSCKKRNSSDEPSTDINPSDPKAVYTNIQVNHGQRVEGQLPSAGNNGPELEAPENGKSTFGIVGKYAIIKPVVTSGDIAGYYLKIQGYDGGYFKIDYSKPVSGRKSVKPHKRLSPLMRVMDGGDAGYSDSLIIISLPENFKPGTFCVEYRAYDRNANAGNMIKECVEITALAGEENLLGNWTLKRTRDEDETEWTEWPYREWWYKEYFYCKDGKLTTEPTSDDDELVELGTLGYFMESFNFSFDKNGTCLWSTTQYEGELDLEKSTCSNLVYKPHDDEPTTESAVVFWSYNKERKRLILLWEQDGIPDFWEWQIESLTADSFLTKDKYNDYKDIWGLIEFVQLP